MRSMPRLVGCMSPSVSPATQSWTTPEQSNAWAGITQLRITSRKQEAQDAVSPDHCPPRVHWSTGPVLRLLDWLLASLGLPLRRLLVPSTVSESSRSRTKREISPSMGACTYRTSTPLSLSWSFSTWYAEEGCPVLKRRGVRANEQLFGKPVCPLVMWRFGLGRGGLRRFGGLLEESSPWVARLGRPRVRR